jgi:hypothetical protein
MKAPALELADIFRIHGPAYLNSVALRSARNATCFGLNEAGVRREKGRMYTQSASARWNREIDLSSELGLTSVEATGDRGEVPLRVDALSKCYGAIEAIAG